MATLKKIFPYSFAAKKDVAALIINLLVYIVVSFVAGLLIGLLSAIPILGLIFRIIGSVIELYVFVGIVLSVLDYLKVLK